MELIVKYLAHIIILSSAIVAKILMEIGITKEGYKAISMSYIIATFFWSISFGSIIGFATYLTTDSSIWASIVGAIGIFIGVDGLVLLKTTLKDKMEQKIKDLIDKTL